MQCIGSEHIARIFYARASRQEVHIRIDLLENRILKGGAIDQNTGQARTGGVKFDIPLNGCSPNVGLDQNDAFSGDRKKVTQVGGNKGFALTWHSGCQQNDFGARFFRQRKYQRGA